MDSLVGLLIGLAFLWALGASLAFVLLMPLKPIADRAPPWLSVPIFTVIGFSVAALVDYQLIHVGAHGQPPPIETEPWTDLALGMVAMGLMGAGCAVASWLSIKRTARRDDSKQARR